MTDGQIGIKAVEVGGRLLRALSVARLPAPLKQLAAEGDMSPSKAHRYLSSFVEVGLVSQDKRTRLYSLGPLAMQIGLAALGAYEPLKAAIGQQADLRNRFDETFVLSVWSAHGPIVVHVDESSQPIIMTMRVGAVLPLLSTATGLAFIAHLPPHFTEPLIGEAFRKGAGHDAFASTWDGLNRARAAVRADGHAYNRGHLARGISALAVPIVDTFGSLVAVTAVMGQDEHVNPARRPELAEAMKLRPSARAAKTADPHGSVAQSRSRAVSSLSDNLRR